jgi:4-diphosphocytidyl-2-C-methyl-D-erythritol kinase
MPTEAGFARAKINLTLHVTGRRADGYHLLDSLVSFAGVGDLVEVTDPGTGFTLTGPEAGALTDDPDNLCLKAARAMGGGVAVRLQKNLPVASGIGGGSADAAAVLRAMVRLGRPLPSPDAVLALGADVPVCLADRPVRMTGVGERLLPVDLPPGWLVLVNPRVKVPTPAVFAALALRDNPAMPEPGRLADLRSLVALLLACRNDLEAPALTLAPVIAEAKAALAAQPGCLMARMSGSGATVFGLFAAAAEAADAAAAISRARRDWWVTAAPMGD